MSKFSSPFFLEFVGVPGSGKSTISHRVVEALRGSENSSFSEPTYEISGHPSPRRQVAKLPYAGYGAIHERALVSRYATQADPVALSPSLLFNWLFVRGVVEWNVLKNRAMALDQGLIQALWSFRLSESDDTVAFFRRRLLEVYPRIPSLIVCLEVSLETAESQLDGRVDNQSRVGVVPTASYDVKEAQRAYRFTKSVVHELVNSRPRVAMLALRNDGRADLTTTVESVVNEVEARVQRS